MNFIEFLDEMYVREQGRGYYVLPVRINRKSHMGSVELSKYVRNNYAAEIVNCMIDCLDTFCKGGSDNFIIQSRKSNISTLGKLCYDINNKNDLRIFASKLISNLDPKNFVDDRSIDGTHAYIFRIPKQGSMVNPYSDKKPIISKSSFYLKFSFIYNVGIKDKNIKYTSVDKNNFGDLVIIPKVVILNQISIHSSRLSKTSFDDYIDKLEFKYITKDKRSK